MRGDVSKMKGINPRQMKQAMKKMGITNRPMDNVIEVVIRCRDKNVIITDADVNVITVQGADTYQITGTVTEKSSEEISVPAMIPEEDIELVISQTQCDRKEAIAALEACNKQPAEAILKIMTE